MCLQYIISNVDFCFRFENMEKIKSGFFLNLILNIGYAVGLMNYLLILIAHLNFTLDNFKLEGNPKDSNRLTSTLDKCDNNLVILWLFFKRRHLAVTSVSSRFVHHDSTFTFRDVLQCFLDKAGFGLATFNPEIKFDE